MSTKEPHLAESFAKTIEDLVRESLASLLTPLEKFLKSHHMEHHFKAFEAEEITYDLLPYLTEEELKKIIPVGAVKKLVLALKNQQSL